jgi:pimeloyl-ACP methyl ester carboxylesterase
MTTHTHRTAPTQYVEANGVRFAYRRFGKAGGVPLVFNQHFTGTMDHWDPVTDGLSKSAKSFCSPAQPSQMRRDADANRQLSR